MNTTSKSSNSTKTETRQENSATLIGSPDLPAPIDFFINSKYASYFVNGTTFKSDMIFYFTPIPALRDTNFKIKLINFVFPVSFYLVDTNNQTLYFKTTAYTLTNGNYNVNTFLTMLTTILASESISISYSSITNKYTFSRPIASGSFFFGGLSKCLTLLGFPENTTTATSTISGSNYILTSTQPVNLSGQYNTVYVDLVNFSASNMGSTNGKRSSVLCSIPVAVNQGALMYFVNNTDSHSILQDNQITFLHLRILGEDLVSPVNFQGVDWSMNVEISYVPHIQVPPTQNSLDYNQSLQVYLQKLNSIGTNKE